VPPIKALLNGRIRQLHVDRWHPIGLQWRLNCYHGR
jgi:hypothetical protein